ncbi:histidinol-phosphatase HisJ [Atrimonas thermophila]|uniref:histidinol-phosphatase HisJ n=1 Tax=Atrimonas thermophila TaxID=3064161 RepID=UPI00399CEAFC
MLCDYHVHTFRCGDAQGNYQEYVQRAIEVGLSEIGFSGHSPQYFLPPHRRKRIAAIPEEELSLYVEEVKKLKKLYQGTIEIRLGLEVDYIPGKEKALTDLLEGFDWDYLLLSVHFIDEWPFDNPRYIRFFERYPVDLVYKKYYRALIEGMKTGLFDVVAHFDLPKKFGFFPTRPIPEEKEALAVCADMGMTLELNTAGWRKMVRDAYPSFAILKSARQMGIRVCLGSDAHRPEDVGRDFDRARELLKKAGFESLVAFSKRGFREYSLP